MATSEKLPMAEEIPDTAGPSAVRIVLFGMPSAGKTSLLGALSQAADVQERRLQAQLIDLSNRLAEIRRLVYEVGKTGETVGEIVPYPVDFEPFEPDSTRSYHAVLYDCDGREANDLLEQRRTFDKPGKSGDLSRAILRADSLILVIDASGKYDEIERDFREFRRFLRHLTRHRSDQRTVGGLPVFLVLAQCDKLVRMNDSTESWLRRVEEKKAEVYKRFQEFLGGEDDSVPGEFVAGFGSIDLRVTATATHTPELADTSPNEHPQPWNVAELFSDTLKAARIYRSRRNKSGRWLLLTVAASLGLITLIGGLAFALIGLVQPEEEIPLANKVRNFQSREPSTASRQLASGTLIRRIRELTELQDDPDFTKISPELQEFVSSRLSEANDYRDFSDRLESVPPPAAARSEDDLEALRKSLLQLEVPKKYQSGWKQTDAVQLREKWLIDIGLLEKATRELYEWYDRLAGNANQLLVQTRSLDPKWSRDIDDLLNSADNLPYSSSQVIEGSISVSRTGGGRLTYGTAERFDLVNAGRRNWEAAKQRLEQLRDMAIALGMLDNAKDSRAVLAVPPPDDDMNLLAECQRRMARLRELYPRYPEWNLNSVPDSVREDVRDALEQSKQNLILMGQELIQDHLKVIRPAGPLSYADWVATADWLYLGEVVSWRDLLGTVEGLLAPGRTGAVSELVSFLRQDKFEIRLTQIGVKIPADLGNRPRPEGDFELYFRKAGGGGITRPFRPTRNGLPDEDGYYWFSISPEVRLTFSPGDTLTGKLVINRNLTRNYELTWVNYPAKAYEFGSLRRPPYFHEDTATAAAGELRPKVKVQFVPTDGVPVIPELFPVVNR